MEALRQLDGISALYIVTMAALLVWIGQRLWRGPRPRGGAPTPRGA